MSPYIVTTKRRGPGLSNLGQEDRDRITASLTSRRAVATLDEARAAAWNAVTARNDSNAARFDLHCQDAHHLPEQGGTITLPDGTVIEVEEVVWPKLARLAGFFPHTNPSPEAQSQILAAFNEAQGGPR